MPVFNIMHHKQYPIWTTEVWKRASGGWGGDDKQSTSSVRDEYKHLFEVKVFWFMLKFFLYFLVSDWNHRKMRPTGRRLAPPWTGSNWSNIQPATPKLQNDSLVLNPMPVCFLRLLNLAAKCYLVGNWRQKLTFNLFSPKGISWSLWLKLCDEM